ncbi:transmembrane protein 45A-like [Pyrus ussuriensis x Pyrus communis]|uniref:Transmembrane protein 45A-like n=1 Tax=Pyrus ussuriensis x Pyrus communis TaxID=2448454 RepID=A0A5N5H0Z3_9ROSA|nr:transmembrane protein 45A-like [Pyrus x bretschneideri]KAB2619752.1 transmembrane protein 45A-like [Pyrus ussuriensis x Pyrus communis]
MGTLVGHVAPGFGFLLIGLWHLFNHIKLHLNQPNTYTAPSWFPTSKFKYLELFLIMGGSSASIAMELFIGPQKHQPLDDDGTIPTNHLHNFEHSSISMTFLVYAAFAIVLDKISPKAQHGLTQLLGAIAFGQQLLLFHLHSADHMGPEGQYHMLLQLVVLVSLTTTLMGIGLPESFLVSFVRSLSIFFQGVWLMVMGFMLWTPDLMPKGCSMNLEEGHKVVRCHGDEALHRAKSLVNLQFSWFLLGVAIFGVSFYLVLVKVYGEKVEYFSLTRLSEEDEEDPDHDVEYQKTSKREDSKSFVNHMGKTAFASIDIER